MRYELRAYPPDPETLRRLRQAADMRTPSVDNIITHGYTAAANGVTKVRTGTHTPFARCSRSMG